MAVKVLIKRKLVATQVKGLDELLRKMRALTLSQKGYISGETFTQVDKEGISLVISTWQSLEDWREWVSSPQRAVIQEQIDALIGSPTSYEIFTNV